MTCSQRLFAGSAPLMGHPALPGWEKLISFFVRQLNLYMHLVSKILMEVLFLLYPFPNLHLS